MSKSELLTGVLSCVCAGVLAVLEPPVDELPVDVLPVDVLPVEPFCPVPACPVDESSPPPQADSNDRVSKQINAIANAFFTDIILQIF